MIERSSNVIVMRCFVKLRKSVMAWFTFICSFKDIHTLNRTELNIEIWLKNGNLNGYLLALRVMDELDLKAKRMI